MTHARLVEALGAGRVLILDGATGTELERRGVPAPAPLWSAAALDTHPDVVQRIHAEYLAAGAEIVVANTFRTNPRALRRAGRSADGPDLCARAVALARAAALDAGRGDAIVVASVGPVEDCYRPDLTPCAAELADEHAEFAAWLAAARPDALWIETMNTQREALAAAQAARAAGLPFGVCFVTSEQGTVLGGDSLNAALAALRALEPVAVGVNCAPPGGIGALLPALTAATDLPIVAYAHIENSEPLPGWSFAEAASPQQYAAHAVEWVRSGARIVGGCCGTTPAHIRALAAALGR